MKPHLIRLLSIIILLAILVYPSVAQSVQEPILLALSKPGILMDDAGSRAFVSCTPDNYVAVIDLRTLEVISHIDVGPGPDGLAWAIMR